MRRFETLRRAVMTVLGALAVVAICNMAAPMNVEASQVVVKTLDITFEEPKAGEKLPTTGVTFKAYMGDGTDVTDQVAQPTIKWFTDGRQCGADTVVEGGKTYTLYFIFSYNINFKMDTIATATINGEFAKRTYTRSDFTVEKVYTVSEAMPASSTAPTTDSSHHQHTYAWETYKAATATTDGIMRYRCTGCGDVEYEVPTAAYYVFNKETQASIQNAAAGATVTVETPIFISFHEMVKEALVARPDVTLVVDYRNAGKTYEMTIPAGSGDTLSALYGDDQYAGFLYLGGAFATVEK